MCKYCKLDSKSELIRQFVLFSFVLLFTCDNLLLTNARNFCTTGEFFAETMQCHMNELSVLQGGRNNDGQPFYIFYDINRAEGFNLRRDVYVRLAVFLRHLRQQDGFKNAKLVLPPFYHLYHWNEYDSASNQLFWNHFFDLDSLRDYTEVMDFPEFYQEMNLQKFKPKIMDLIQLHNFRDIFENGKFIEKFEIVDTKSRNADTFIGEEHLSVETETVVNFQGSAMILQGLLTQLILRRKSVTSGWYSVLINHAEIVLHNEFGEAEYWRARRSMRFSKPLVAVANNYRRNVMNSTDEWDGIKRPANWTHERASAYKPIGGQYACAHLRRADFVRGRENTTPSVISAARQIRKILLDHHLKHVFISSDCTGLEFKAIYEHLSRRFKVHRFVPASEQERNLLRDGGIAVVDQIICSHARYFIGTYESTFTYRIYEERNILNFRPTLTFNTFCKYDDESVKESCPRNSEWPIRY